jgi:hypothetical protein
VDNALVDVSGVAEAALIDVLVFELILFDLLFLLSQLFTLALPLPLDNFGMPTTGLTSMGDAVNNKLGLNGHSSASSKSTSVFGLLVIESELTGGCSLGFKQAWFSASSLITTLQKLKQDPSK